MSRRVWRSLVGAVTTSAPAAGDGFSPSFGLDFIWKTPKNQRRTPMKYYPAVPGSTNKIQVRLEMVKCAMESGISEAARQFETTRKTVRKWVNRFDKSLGSLKDHSKAPKRIPHKISPQQEQELLEYLRRFPRWGPDRLKAQFNFPYSTRTIARIFSQHGLTKHRRKKYKKKRELREMKRNSNRLK